MFPFFFALWPDEVGRNYAKTFAKKVTYEDRGYITYMPVLSNGNSSICKNDLNPYPPFHFLPA